MVDFLIYLAASLAGAAFLLTLWRFIVGPTAADRIIAFDGLTIVSITGIVLGALADRQPDPQQGEGSHGVAGLGSTTRCSARRRTAAMS